MMGSFEEQVPAMPARGPRILDDEQGAPPVPVEELLEAWNHLPQPVRDLLLHCMRTFRVKGADYTSGSPDRLVNFKEAADDTGITPRQAWYVLVRKHWSAIRTFVRKGRVESEPLAGRIVDVIVYSTLLYLMALEDGEPPVESRS